MSSTRLDSASPLPAPRLTPPPPSLVLRSVGDVTIAFGPGGGSAEGGAPAADAPSAFAVRTMTTLQTARSDVSEAARSPATPASSALGRLSTATAGDIGGAVQVQ